MDHGQSIRHLVTMILGVLSRIPWGYSPPKVDRIWLWVYYNKIPIYRIFYLPEGDYSFEKLSHSRIARRKWGDLRLPESLRDAVVAVQELKLSY